MTIGEHLLQVADAGLALSTVAVGEDIFTHLSVLLAIEDSLDKGRVIVGMSDSGTEHMREINHKMDELRNRISAMIDHCDKDEFKQFMDMRARRLQHQFNG